MDPTANNPLLGQIIPPLPPVIVDKEEEFVVEEILDARLFGRGKKLKCLVKWLGYTDPDWQDVEIVNELQVVYDFYQQYPYKLGPLPEGIDRASQELVFSEG